jgi:hypothetical protein
MGLFRNMAKGMMIFFFSLSLTLLVLTIFLYNLTSYEKARTVFKDVFKNFVVKNMSSEEIEELYNGLSLYCKTSKNVSVSISKDTKLDCSEIIDKNSTYLIELIGEKSFDNIYYKDYGCSFLDCLKKVKSPEEFSVVLSSTSHGFFSKILMPLFVFTIVFGAILLILIESWEGRCKTFGLEFLSIGVFFFILPKLKNFFLQKLPEGLPVGESISLVFDEITKILMFFLVLGLILISTWVLIKLRKKSK